MPTHARPLREWPGRRDPATPPASSAIRPVTSRCWNAPPRRSATVAPRGPGCRHPAARPPASGSPRRSAGTAGTRGSPRTAWYQWSSRPTTSRAILASGRPTPGGVQSPPEPPVAGPGHRCPAVVPPIHVSVRRRTSDPVPPAPPAGSPDDGRPAAAWSQPHRYFGSPRTATRVPRTGQCPNAPTPPAARAPSEPSCWPPPKLPMSRESGPGQLRLLVAPRRTCPR